MAGLIGFIITTIIALGVGGFGFAYIFYFSKRKKITYQARCYQITDSVKNKIKKEDGSFIDVNLSELRPFMSDVLEVIEKKHGLTIFRLRRQGISTSEVKAKHIEQWGNEKYVDVLVDGKTATLLEKGYDKKSGDVIFHPMPREDIDLITTNILERRDRNIKEEKSILAAITPWIIMGIVAIMFVAGINAGGSIYLEGIKENKEITKMTIDGNKEIVENQKQIMQTIFNSGLVKSNIKTEKFNNNGIQSINQEQSNQTKATKLIQ